jgi:uncharacterized protein YqfA (UPF0365 family)
MQIVMSIPPDFFIMIIVAIILSTAFLILPIPNWILARRFGAKITFMEAMFMSFRKVPARRILNALGNAAAAKLDITADELEKHAVAGGDVRKVVLTLIIAKKKGHQLYKNDVFESDFKGTILKDFSDFL